MHDTRVARIESDLREFVRASYPEMIVRAEIWDRDTPRIALFFIDEQFRSLYRRQRYHYLIHLIPKNYFDANLADALWFELTPDENPENLDDDPDDDLIESITPDVLAALQRANFFQTLDNLFLGAGAAQEVQACSGDFRLAKTVFQLCGIDEADWSEVFHVLMAQGAFCDCEILLNAAPESRLRAQYWRRISHEAQS